MHDCSLLAHDARDDDDRAFWERAAQGWKALLERYETPPFPSRASARENEWGGRSAERTKFRRWSRKGTRMLASKPDEGAAPTEDVIFCPAHPRNRYGPALANLLPRLVRRRRAVVFYQLLVFDLVGVLFLERRPSDFRIDDKDRTFAGRIEYTGSTNSAAGAHRTQMAIVHVHLGFEVRLEMIIA